MAETRLALDDGSLVDLLDRLLDTGVALDGTVLITLAGVDLIRLDLRLLLASVETLCDAPDRPDRPLHRQDGIRGPGGRPFHMDDRRVRQVACAAPLAQVPAPLAAPARVPPPPAAATVTTLTAGHAALALTERPDDRAPGVAGLVVALVDLVRQLLERQALRRMEGGRLTDDEVERLGTTLRVLERQVRELADSLGLHPPPR